MAGQKAATLACVILLAATGAACAVDLPPVPALDPPSAEAEEFSGWYLRGDVGVGTEAGGLDLTTSPNPLHGENPGGLPYSSAATQSFTTASLTGIGEFDVGVGYQLNKWLRGDLTIEYRGGTTLRSTYTIDDPASPTTQYSAAYRGNVSSVIGLANLYADVGTWFGITPFVGGGLGLANNRIGGLTSQAVSYYGPGNALQGSGAADYANGSTNAFAWALMTGLDISVARSLKLEFGYRYLNYGGLRSGGSSCPGVAAGSTIASGACRAGTAYTVASTSNLASSDFRVGLIWEIGDALPSSPARPF